MSSVFPQANDPNKVSSYENTLIALLSNVVKPPPIPDYTFDLEIMPISDHDFLCLFYNNLARQYCVSTSNAYNEHLSFTNKYYVTAANQLASFHFSDMILKKNAEHRLITNNTIPSLHIMSSLKETLKIKNLAQIQGFQQALTWPEVIDMLITSEKIVVSEDISDEAKVVLAVQFIYVDPYSQLNIATNFNYEVTIRGYLNLGLDSPVKKVEEPMVVKVEEPVVKVEEPVVKVEEPAVVKVEEPAVVKVEEPVVKVEEEEEETGDLYKSDKINHYSYDETFDFNSAKPVNNVRIIDTANPAINKDNDEFMNTLLKQIQSLHEADGDDDDYDAMDFPDDQSQWTSK
uniref:Uncharacterized protein n=1 Tax=viral metagenome TaxID=1070528 RepID=A0A6C0LFV2_9ZZZZ